MFKHHVSCTQVKELLSKAVILKASHNCKNNFLHSARTYTFVVNHGQDMEGPFFGKTLTGDTYHYTLMSVYNCVVINSVNIHEGDDEPKDMHCHVYNEGVIGNSSNNFASLIMKTL